MTDEGKDIPHPKRRGEWAELRFMTRAAEHGLILTRPWGDTTPYDVGIDHNGRLLRVQVKCTLYRRRNSYKCHLDTNGVPYNPHQIDFIAAYVIPADAWYILPLAATNHQSDILLTPHNKDSKYAPHQEAWHLLRAERATPCGTDTPFDKAQGRLSPSPLLLLLQLLLVLPLFLFLLLQLFLVLPAAVALDFDFALDVGAALRLDGAITRTRPAPKGRKKLLPNLSLVIDRVVLLQKRHKFFLKRMLLMMFFLLRDVLRDCRDIRFTNAEHPISGLPCKLRAPLLPHPPR